MEQSAGEITLLLHQWREGNKEAENRLFALVIPDLRRLAQFMMQRERKNHSLQATELVDQIYFRMVAAKDRDWQSRKHFFAIAARAMRRHLVDHARARPSAEFVEIGELEDRFRKHTGRLEVAIAVDHLLHELEETRPDWSMLVEMKVFLGLTDEEAAEATGLRLRTMQRSWAEARRWLFVRMKPDAAQGVSP